MDVDAVSLATFDIDSNGMLLLWSPYANITDTKMLKASEKLSMPTGVKTKIEETDNIQDITLLKYKGLFNITNIYNTDKKFNTTIDTKKLSVSLKLDNPLNILELANFLKETPTVYKPSAKLQSNFVNLIAPGVIKTKEQFDNLFEEIAKIVDRHNLYFDKMNHDKISRIQGNFLLKSMYDTIADPVNLTQAHISVDGTTGPLRKVSELSNEAKEAQHRSPGNFVNLYESIVENLVGKDGIGICAVGLKSFFALTLYYNYVLNKGTTKQQSRLILGKDGYLIRNNMHSLLANVRCIDPSTVTEDRVRLALARQNNTTDAAIILSALLSLSTDNAKELVLSKLNANSLTIGMYIYGISIGMDFRDIASIIMSPTGLVLSKIASSNVFTGDSGYNDMTKALSYFSRIPYKLISKYSSQYDPDGNNLRISPLEYLTNSLALKEDADTHKFNLNDFIEIAKQLDIKYSYRLLDELRNDTKLPRSEYFRSTYNLLIDTVLEYIFNIKKVNYKTLQELGVLAAGAKEMRVFGQVLGLNLGIKTDPESYYNLVNALARCIYNTTENENDIIDIPRFAFDPKYREYCIDQYEKVKHSFNILDVVSTVPHYMGYVLTLAIDLMKKQRSFKFRSTNELIHPLSKKIGVFQENSLIKGIEQYIGDYTRNQWMLSRGLQITIPKGSKRVSSTGNIYSMKQDTTINLGNQLDNATFRMFMERTVIPNLKNGIIKEGVELPALKDNKFLLDLTYDITTRTVSENADVIYTLPINMMPRTDSESNLLNLYKAEFNKLAAYAYEYNTTSYDLDGNEITTTNRIPIVDLFTYYAMIAHNWRLSENSLVPILESFRTTGKLLDFINFEKELDNSGITLSLNNIDFNDILPYVALKESPYMSKLEYIWHRNPETHKYELMEKVGENERNYGDDDNLDNEDIKNTSINGYTYIEGPKNLKLSSNYIENPEKLVNAKFMDNGNQINYSFLYNSKTGKLIHLSTMLGPLDIKGFDNIFTKKNGIKVINSELIEMYIHDKLNACK